MTLRSGLRRGAAVCYSMKLAPDQVSTLAYGGSSLQTARALIEPDYEEMDEPEAKRAKKAHDAEALVLATNWQLYKEESDNILKREDRHFKSLRAAEDFDKEHVLNVRELLGFIDEHQGKQIMDHPLMREAPMLYNAFKVINQLFGNLDESGLAFHHQIAKILGLVIDLKNIKIESWRKFITDWKQLIAASNVLKMRFADKDIKYEDETGTMSEIKIDLGDTVVPILLHEFLLSSIIKSASATTNDYSHDSNFVCRIQAIVAQIEREAAAKEATAPWTRPLMQSTELSC
ncbi:hypothetical protein BC830DRAFT_806687 [Chytriomyces sp. MP71]|nr:hypothetical protein BC830DRAFT_806687 [Chytriomyces sp. MP71]